MRTCIILNPHAGTIIAQPALLDRLRAVYGSDLWLTQQPHDATTLARTALQRGYERVVAAGGDGTISEVLNGLAPQFERVQFGILPVGTANDFARSIDLPVDFEAALALLSSGVTRKLDLVQITTDSVCYCINVSAGGISGMFNELAADAVDTTWRPLAYLRAAMQMVSHLTAYHTIVTYDDEPPFTISLSNLVIANGRYVAHGVPIAPTAEVDDGWLDVILFRAATVPELVVLTPQVIQGQHLDNDQVVFRRARRIVVQSDPPMWLSVEGEVLGMTPVTYQILPHVLEVITGRSTLPPSDTRY